MHLSITNFFFLQVNLLLLPRGGVKTKEKKFEQIKSIETRQITLSTDAVSGAFSHLRHYEYPPNFSP